MKCVLPPCAQPDCSVTHPHGVTWRSLALPIRRASGKWWRSPAITLQRADALDRVLDALRWQPAAVPALADGAFGPYCCTMGSIISEWAEWAGRRAASLRLRPWRLFCVALWMAPVLGAAQSIDCSRPPAGSIEVMVCADEGLMALDREMAAIYAAALKKAVRERPPMLKAEQRGWIKGRNDCWKAEDRRACVVDAYARRKVELQARYRLVSASAPVRFVCGDSPADEVTVTHFRTEPPVLIAERGDQSSLMSLVPSASGSRYVGRNESLWEHQGEASIVWGYQAPEMRCRLAGGRIDGPLARTAWQLIAIRSMDDAQGTFRMAHPERFSLQFAVDGRARVRLDCNRGSATWAATPSADVASGALLLGPVAMTRRACAKDSPGARVLRDLRNVRSYLLKDGRLFLSLMADGGILEWAPATP